MISLISNIHHHSVSHIYEGYRRGFQSLIPHDLVIGDIRELSQQYSLDRAWALIMSQCLISSNNITHAVFVSGLQVPYWVFETLNKRGIHVSVIANDDPHSSLELINANKHINTHFTNEITMDGYRENIKYLPSATDPLTINKDKIEEKEFVDVSFVGTIYPTRVPVLEKIVEYCQMNNLSFNIIGPCGYIPSDSSLRCYVKDAIIPNNKMRVVSAASKLCINIERDINWKTFSLLHNGDSLISSKLNEVHNSIGNIEKAPGIEHADSIDPRGYEIATCETVQMFIGDRKEPKEVFGGNAIYSSSDLAEIEEALNGFFSIPEKQRKVMAQKAKNIVLSEHTYKCRAIKILKEFGLIN